MVEGGVALKLSYYPGCSLDSTAKEYDLSTRVSAELLGIELRDLPDWSCCGASSGHCTDFRLGVALPTRNLLIAEEQGLDLAVACAGCFVRLREASHQLNEDEKLRGEIAGILGHPYKEKIRTLHLLEIITKMVGLEEVRRRVKKPLRGLKVASYYGCVLVRPPKVTGIDDAENPQSMDQLMEALGAEPIEWSYKIDCCGGSLALTRTEIAEKLVADIMQGARDAGATCVVTACPLCQANLDDRQPPGKAKLPTLYFTELLGVALGAQGTEDWFRRHIVDPLPLLKKLQLV